MKIQLQHVKTTLEKAEALTQRVAALEVERVDLRLEIQNPATAKAAQARSDALSAEIKAAQDELDEAINALRLALRSIPALVIENKAGQQFEAEKATREFLQSNLVSPGQIQGGDAFIEDLIHKIASNFNSVRIAKSLIARFSGVRFSTLNTDHRQINPASDHHHIHPTELFALANEVLEHLAEV